MNRKAQFCRAILGVVAATALAGGGCVERKITIGSNPSGALVYVNDVEMGRTPVTFPFTWYGDYDIRLRYETNSGTPESPVVQQYYLHTNKRASAPVYQWMGIDLFAEILPIEFKDEKVWAFNVLEVKPVSDTDLIAHAKELQARLDAPTGFEKKSRVVKTGPITAPATAPATKPAH